jgi:hypothetical protein
MRISWLVCSAESKSCLREYNLVGVRWCMYSGKCTGIYIGKLNSLNKIMTLQCSNNWQPDIFDEQRQYTILSLLAHLAVLSAGSRLPMPLCVTAFPRPAQWSGCCPFQWLFDPQCPKLPSTWDPCRGKTLTPHMQLPSSSQGPECMVTRCSSWWWTWRGPNV